MTFDEARAIAHKASVAFSDACQRVAYNPVWINQHKFEVARKDFMNAIAALDAVDPIHG